MLMRKAVMGDLEETIKIYSDAKKFMRKAGNPTQWDALYPSEEEVISDIKEGSSYVITDKEEVIAAFHFHIGKDDTYEKIYQGEWKNDLPYAVIHRIAVKYHGRGIADFCYSECYKLFNNLKIDTHRNNIPMQKSLRKNGFVYCGIVHLANGEERMAFQRC